MGPGSISEIAAIAHMEHISKAEDTRRSFAVADIVFDQGLGREGAFCGRYNGEHVDVHPAS